MGQKTIVTSLKLLKKKTWNSFVYVDFKNYKQLFEEDFALFLYLRSKSKLVFNLLRKQHIYQIEVRKSILYRINKSLILNLHLIYLKSLNKKLVRKFIMGILLNITRIFNRKTPKFIISYKIGKNNAIFFALQIASLLEKRIRFQSKLVNTLLLNLKCQGARVVCKGRLNLVDRAKKVLIFKGPVPLQSINASIDYGLIIANTKKGLQSIKIWIFNKI